MKALRKLDRRYQHAIITAIETLALVPRPHGVKKLQGGEGEYRLRVGVHRVIYEIHDGELVIVVLRIGQCKDLYRKLSFTQHSTVGGPLQFQGVNNLAG